jgi:oligoribonuclease
MDEWNTRQHGQSGLVERVKQSSVSEAEAERETIRFLEQYVPAGKSPMCGNSICQDRRFLARCMPELEAFFHYRNLDVSSLKELASRWYPGVLQGFTKQGAHLAMDDVRDSIRELQYYRETILK